MTKKYKNKKDKFINPIPGLFRYTWKYAADRRKLVLLAIVLSALAQAFVLTRPLLVARVFNSVQFEADDPRLLDFVIFNLSLLLLLTVGFWIFHGISRIIEQRNSFFIQRNFRLSLFSKVMDLPAEWQKDHHSGDTIDKVNKAGTALDRFSDNLFQVTENVVRLIGSIAVLAFFDLRATVILVFFTIFIFWFVAYTDIYLRKLLKKIIKAENKLAAGIHDYISNIITVITLRLKKKAYSEMEKRSMLEYGSFKKFIYLNEAKWALISVFISLLTVFLLVLNAYSSYKTEGVIVLATLFVLFQYLQQVTGVFFNFAWMLGMWTQMHTKVTAVEEILEEHKKLENKEKHRLPPDWQSIQIKQLNFDYKNKNKKEKLHNIHNIQLNIKRKERIALIGESGSGKSTVLALLRGLHEEKSSLVYVDGKKQKGGMSHFYDHMTLIPQEPEIFNATIRENITMGYRIARKELDWGIDLAKFRDVLNRLENGLETNVMEKGVSLSGGEKQRLALARGLVLAKKYDFILLDEPTSSVDSGNEIEIYDSVFQNFSEKTILSAVHRLHLLPKFDYIYLFDSGKIIAEGTFKTLLKEKAFRKVWDKYIENNKHY